MIRDTAQRDRDRAALASRSKARARAGGFFGMSLATRPRPSALDFTTPEYLSLSGWWRGSYSTSPLAGSASAGTSGGKDLAEDTNPPGIGALLGGFAPMDFDGNNDRMVGAFATTFLATNFSIWILFKADVLAADPGAAAPYNGPGISDASGAPIAVALHAGGVRAGYYDGTWGSVSQAPATAMVGNWHLARVRSDGTKIEISVDSNAWTNVARGAYIPASSFLRVGVGYAASTFFNGCIMEVGTAKTTFSDATFDDVKAYINARYGLTL